MVKRYTILSRLSQTDNVTMGNILALRQNLGICLVFTGVTTSMFLNYFFPVVYWTPFVMLLSCILLCDSSTFCASARWNRPFKSILMFQGIMLLYFVFYFNEAVSQLWFKQLSFHLYIIVLAIVLMRTKILKDRNFLPILFVYSSILSFIAAFCHFTGLIEMERMLYVDKAVLEVFSCNIAAFINFITCLLMLDNKKKKWMIFFLALMVVDFYVIMQSGKRSYYVSLLATGVIYLYKMKCLKRGIIIVSAVYLLLNLLVPEVRDMTVKMIERTIDGFSAVYIDKKSTYVDWDDSASIRAWSQRMAVQKLNNFSLFNYIFGGGYLFHFFDNPLGESYIEMGILGFCFYVYLIVIMPIKFFLRLGAGDKKEMFCFFVALMNICIILVNTDPYVYMAYTPLCMMALFSYKSDFIRYKNLGLL